MDQPESSVAARGRGGGSPTGVRTLEGTREHRKTTRRRLAALLQDGPLDIVQAALVVATEEYPDLDVAREKRRLGSMGNEAAHRVAALQNPFARLDALRSYL